MRRNRLKNIINKSKELSNKQQLVGESPFEQFKNSLPEELESFKGDNYRLEAAWKAYGSPKNYEEAVWLGLVNPLIPGKMPSIGYNEESDEYEYLNTGKENDIVAKDIRVWDNDVIPLVKELKLGGYVRTFNEEKNCWTYSKNPLKGIEPSENNELQIIEEFKKGGKNESTELIIPSFLTLDENGNYVSKYYSDDDEAEDIKWYRSKESKDFRKKFRLNDLDWEDGTPDGKFFTYIPKKKYKDLWFKKYGINITGSGSNSPMYYSDPNGDIADGKTLEKRVTQDGEVVYVDDEGNAYDTPYSFKQGGQMNVIPEGALHARKNNMELAKEGEVTHKGIPVVDNQGELQAEIERNEIIFTKETTNKIEGYYKKFKDDSTSTSEKDELAIKCGKFLVDLILNNTDDKTGLIEEVKLNI